MKISSRAGRFKKKLISLENLQLEAPLIQTKMAPFYEMLDQKLISSAEFCGLYILLCLSHRFPRTWAGARRTSFNIPHQLQIVPPLTFEPNIQMRVSGLSLGEIFNQFALKSTPLAVNRALLSWSAGTYPLELMFRIPFPREVLEQQRQGRRCLTILTDAQRISDYILGERDHLSFTMHDLIHADHFYFNNDCYLGQLGFYGMLSQAMDQGIFDELLEMPAFRDEFEYLIADMNAYAVHLLKCLKAAMLHYGPTKKFEEWIKDFPVKDSLLLLNSQEYIPEKHDSLILNWLDQFNARGIL